MADFDQVIYLLDNAGDNFAGLLASDADVMVVESQVSAFFQNGMLTPAEVAQLSSGRDLMAYVNVAVTDAYRAYWDPSWTINPATGMPFTASDLDWDDADIRAVAPGAPLWLSDPYGLATGPAEETSDGSIPIYGPIVDFSDGQISLPANASTSLIDANLVADDSWWGIVLGQVRANLDYGYRGIFLDDVSRYFVADVGLQTAAQEMLNLIEAVQHEIRAFELNTAGVSEGDITLSINGGGYLMWNNGDGLTQQEETIFGNIDYLVMENAMQRDAEAFWEVGQNLNALGADTQIISIEWQNAYESDALVTPEFYAAYLNWLNANGVEILGHFPETAAYAELSSIPAPTPTAGFDAEMGDFTNDRLEGGIGPNLIAGLAGQDKASGSSAIDWIDGGSGQDRVDGGAGDDVIFGGDGGDIIHGGDGDDIIYGGPGDDIIFAGGGNDIIYGGGGNDIIYGGDGNDLIYGGDGQDRIFGQGGVDELLGEEGDDRIIAELGETVDAIGADDILFL